MISVYTVYKYYDKIFSNKFENDIFKIISKERKKKLVVYDIGCYVGSFSKRLDILLSKKFKIKYFLFDPIPNIKKEIKHLNFNYKFYNLAAGNKEGVKKFNLNTKNSWAGSSLVNIPKNSKLFNYSRNFISFNFGKKLFKTIKVNSIILDKFIKKNKLQSPDILKIDVEGAELDVLEGIAKNIKQTKIIYLEILDEKDRWDLKFKKIDKFMKKNNFKFFKSSRIIEGSILSTLKIVDVIYINKYSIYNLTH
jgi:FkbM family methyltransferase